MTRLDDLARLIDRFAMGEGVTQTALPRVRLVRVTAPVERSHGVQPAAVCIIARGTKQVTLGEETYSYDASRYLVATHDMPVTGRVLHATPDDPYLCVVMELDPHELASLVLQSRPAPGPADAPRRGIFLADADDVLIDAMIRLLRLLDDPTDLATLAPMAEREVLYRLLRGPHGARVAEVAIAHSHAQRIGRAIAWLRSHFREPLRIEEFARLAHMSPSTLHHHFKAVTAMSPLQYQKQLRLQEARRLLLAEGLDAASAGHRVGYESASQFSREYSRLFGEPPARDRRRMREMGSPAAAA